MARAIVLMLGLLVALTGCPGKMPEHKDLFTTSTRDWVPWPGREGITKTGDGWKPADGKKPGDGKIPPDSKAWKGDRTPWKTDTKIGPLPDKPSTTVSCTPSGGCNVDSACAASEICINVTGTSSYICKPATSTAGGACNNTLWCPNHTVCVGFSGTGDGTCRVQCTAVGQPCGTAGGTCAAYQSCLYCSK